MNQGIRFEKIWCDDDLYELQICSSDGKIIFINKTYVGHDNFDQTIADLDELKKSIHGGIHDLQLGSFGPEYASGAFSARLHFQDSGKIHVSIHAESEYFDFGKKIVANEVKLYFKTEPSLLDDFILQLKLLKSGQSNEASLIISK